VKLSFIFFQVKGLLRGFQQMKPAKNPLSQEMKLRIFLKETRVIAAQLHGTQ
jgi:hypothetical protein